MPKQGSGFTFATGNAQKVLALPLYLFGAIATRFVRRQPGLWVFGSGSGVGEGALALYHHTALQSRARELVWLTSNERDAAAAAALGIRAVPKLSSAGFRLTLRAGVIVVTHGFGDVNRYATRGAFVVQLWHGIPLKHIQLDSAVTFSSRFGPLRGLLRRAYRRSAAQINLLPAASELSAARLRTAFGLASSRVVVTGDPRDDVVVATSRDAARSALAALIGQLDGEVLLYAPTWRDGEVDPAVPSASEWQAIGAWLGERGATLVVRPHPHGVGDYAAGVAATPNTVMLASNVVQDVTPLLPAFDAVVTDYSSIAFDYALTGGPIAFLAPDVASYSESRGLYEPYKNFSGGTEVTSWSALLEVLGDPKHVAGLRAHSIHLASTHHEYRDGQNTARVYAEIVSRLEGTRMNPSITAGTSVPIASVTLGDDATVTFTGFVSDALPSRLELVGARAVLGADATVSGDRWTAIISLLASRWSSAALPAPGGHYELVLRAADGVTLSGHAPITAGLVPGVARVEIAGSTLALSAPLTADEHGTANQARLEKEYRSRPTTPANAVFFESFYGQNASCNPRAIDAAVARLSPATERFWSVVDASVAVPEGAIPIIEGSSEWWRVRGEARLLVVNDWLRKRYLPRKHQTVVQTWHGTMLKKIANDRPDQGLRAKIASALESRRWDVLLSQNPFSTETLRRSYRYRGPVWEEGYPRDDVLATPDGAAIRARLGIAPDTTVLLYAPTWRDDRLEHIDHLDVSAFTSALGEGYVTLIRGHSRTLRPGRNVEGSSVIDVTGYPDVADLFLIADVLITDYSSVMFDFSVTGKPIFFFTPDLDHYRERLRGFYFDLLEVAPGPVVQDADELVALVARRDELVGEYASAYAAWRERFNPRDDGHAADRVVQRLLDEGKL